jgi:multiple antibiotic resistance protein
VSGKKLTFPLTTGPGTIAASIALGAQVPTKPFLVYVAGNVAVACGAALVSLTLYFLFRNAASVLKRLGEVGTLVMIRLMAFILLCIGIRAIHLAPPTTGCCGQALWAAMR